MAGAVRRARCERIGRRAFDRRAEAARERTLARRAAADGIAAAGERVEPERRREVARARGWRTGPPFNARRHDRRGHRPPRRARALQLAVAAAETRLRIGPVDVLADPTRHRVAAGVGGGEPRSRAQRPPPPALALTGEELRVASDRRRPRRSHRRRRLRRHRRRQPARPSGATPARGRAGRVRCTIVSSSLISSPWARAALRKRRRGAGSSAPEPDAGQDGAGGRIGCREGRLPRRHGERRARRPRPPRGRPQRGCRASRSRPA